jgi:hypothetical protein
MISFTHLTRIAIFSCYHLIHKPKANKKNKQALHIILLLKLMRAEHCLCMIKQQTNKERKASYTSTAYVRTQLLVDFHLYMCAAYMLKQTTTHVSLVPKIYGCRLYPLLP